MITKAKKPAEPPAAAPAAAETPQAEAAAPTAAAPAANATTPPTAPASAPTPTAPARSEEVSDEAVSNLTAMGFPEAEVRHCLRAAHGNPDVAVEFLTNGIPDGVTQAASMVDATNAATPASSSGTSQQPLQALRNHPQFNDLRRLVQSNPQMLQQVLAQIGQQQPELLREINANQALFLEMMNEPITESTTTSSSGPSSSGSPTGGGGMPLGMEGMGNPAQMAQMIQSMSPTELNQMAQMMGISPDQLRMTAQMLGQMPPEQLQQFMMQAMGAGGGGDGMAGLMGGGGGGQQVLRLTEDEMAAVDRLTEMGFDRSDAAQAFLACDKNEALAANLLMDSMGDGGFFGGGGGGGSGSGGSNNDEGGAPGSNNDGGGSGGGGGNDGDDMYD